MLLMHGLGGNKDEITQRFVKPLLADDVAMLALDAPLHGERKTQKGNQTLIKMFFASQESRVKGDLMAQVHSMDPDNAYAKYFAGIVHGGVLDYRLALDYLATRSDVDMKHVGLFGESMGSIMGSILLGVDHRVDFAALAVGGDPALPLLGELPADLRDTVAETCPSLFIGHASGHPVFMLNGLQDDVIPKSATDRLFEAADQPKTIKWYAAKHFLPDQAFKDAEAWSVGLLKSQN